LRFDLVACTGNLDDLGWGDWAGYVWYDVFLLLVRGADDVGRDFLAEIERCKPLVVSHETGSG
jgi:hypothetical protein